MLYNYQVNNNIEKIIILGEYNEYSHNKNAKIELITTKNDKIDSDNKKIDKCNNVIMIIVTLDVILNVVELMDID